MVDRSVTFGLGACQSLDLVVDAGEAEAIALAKEMGVRIILDDRKA